MVKEQGRGREGRRVLQSLADGTHYSLWLVLLQLHSHNLKQWISNYAANFIAFKVGAVASTSWPKDKSILQNDHLIFFPAPYTPYLHRTLWKDQWAEFPFRVNLRLKCGVSRIFKYFHITHWKNFAKSQVCKNTCDWIWAITNFLCLKALKRFKTFTP